MFHPTSVTNFKGCKLIVPCVSVGNVAQLASDLLISTLKMERVGHLYDQCFLPLICQSAFDHNSGALSTSAEVYVSSERQLVVVQLRAPIAKVNWCNECGKLVLQVILGEEKRFVRLLLEWVKEARFSELIILTTTYAHERLDHQILSGSCRFITAPSSPHYQLFIQELGWKLLEERQSLNGDSSEELFLPGAGVAKRLYQESLAAGISVVGLVKFTSQGDNSGDARELADYLNQWLMVKQPKAEWTSPAYWSLMFGNPTPPDIY